MTSSKRVVALSFAILVSLSSMGLAYLYRPFSNSNGAYFKITLDRKTDEAALLKQLQSMGFKDLISESTEWVYLDDFGELERVPLNQYAHRVEPFDPRNDGYAEKLRSLFISDTKRYIYFSMNDLSLSMQNSKLIQKKIGSAFMGQEYTLESIGLARSFFWDAILFLGAILFSLFLTKTPLMILSILPILSSFSLYGSPGLVGAGLSLAFVSSLVNPGRDFLRKKQKGNRDFRLLFDLFSPSLITLLAFFFICSIGSIPIPLSILSLLSITYISMLYLVLSEKNDIKRGHTRFVPLPLKRAYPDLILVSRSTLPFVVASLLVFSLQLFRMDVSREIAGSLPNSKAGASLVDVQGFLQASEKHLAFQKTFSLQSMNEKDDKGSYESYKVAKDGLVDSMTNKVTYSGYSELVVIPPAERMLSKLEHPQAQPSGASLIGAFIAVVFGILFSIPSIRMIIKTQQKLRELPSYSEKRIAA